MHDIASLMERAPVIPVLVIDDAESAVPLAEALVAGGLSVLEVTMRTDCALEAVRRMRDVDGAVVGVGTARTADDLARAHDAGAEFAVTPGLTDALAQKAQALSLPLLPGVATATELMRAFDLGYHALKFFPAEAAGGVPVLKSFAGPFPDARFCPTGGIDTAKARDYLALPNVVCVGGSWVAPTSALESGDWETVKRLAGETGSLRSR